jgi:hypothetical protein
MLDRELIHACVLCLTCTVHDHETLPDQPQYTVVMALYQSPDAPTSAGDWAIALVFCLREGLLRIDGDNLYTTEKGRRLSKATRNDLISSGKGLPKHLNHTAENN